MNALIHVFHSLHIILGTEHIGLKKINKYKKKLDSILSALLAQSAAEDHGTEQSTANLVPDRGWCRCCCCIPAVGWQLHAVRSVQLELENALPLQVGVCVVAAEALGVLAHVAALGARLRRRDEVREDALVASDRGLEKCGA